MVLPAIIGAKAGQAVAAPVAKALTGDIFVRRTTQTVGKGKDKRLVEKELHINPITVGVGAVAVGGAALLTGAALWFMQKKPVVSQGKDLIRIAEEKETTYKTVTKTVVDSEAWTQYLDNVISGGYYLPLAKIGVRCVTCHAQYVIPDGVWTDYKTEIVEFVLEHEALGHLTAPLYETEPVWVPEVLGEPLEVVHDAVTHEETERVVDKEGYTQYYTASGIPLWKKDQLYVTNDALMQREISGGYKFVEEFKQIGTKHWWRFRSDEKYTLGTEDRKVGGLLQVAGPDIDIWPW